MILKKFKFNKTVLLEILKDFVIMIGIITFVTLVCALMDTFKFSASNLIMIYIIGVLLVAVFTKGFIFHILSSIISVFTFNFFFTVPRFTFNAFENEYPLTFIIMFAISITASLIASQLKRQTILAKQVMAEKQESLILAENEKARSNLLRSISHDIRTPLTAISSGANELLENKKIDEDTKKQILLDVRDEAEWLIRLVENMLAITKIDQGKLLVKKQKEAIEEVIPEAVLRVEKLRKNRSINIKIPKDVLLVEMDANLIIQVLINLLENAIKFTSDDGRIDINVTDMGNAVRFMVINNGSPITETDLPKIFDMFYTTNGGSDNAKGTGLGLPICKTIIEAHGGNIYGDNIDYEFGRGVCFIFTLPINKK